MQRDSLKRAGGCDILLIRNRLENVRPWTNQQRTSRQPTLQLRCGNCQHFFAAWNHGFRRTGRECWLARADGGGDMATQPHVYRGSMDGVAGRRFPVVGAASLYVELLLAGPDWRNRRTVASWLRPVGRN